MLQIGDSAPDFTGKSHLNGNIQEEFRLSDFSGKRIALYFYQKDGSPGCTAQGCSIRNEWAQLKRTGITVIGVSADSVGSHQKFASKKSLPFPLVSDTNKEIMKAYGVLRRMSAVLGFMGVKPTTFLIDESGKIVKVITRPKVTNHGKQILDEFAQLQ